MADHITGGEMYYKYLGFNNGEYKYQITGKLFMRCNSGRQFNNPTVFSVFDRSNTTRIRDINITLNFQENINLTPQNKCITNPPYVCYDVGYYAFELSLPASTNGYLIACQVNFRINTISNFTPGYRQVGATYVAEIPGQSQVQNGPENNSAHFTGSDLVVVCANNSFSYSFAAEDSDGDKLRYSFCNAYESSSSISGGNTSPPSTPPYSPVPYGSGFSGSSPLGNNVRINENTGLITGIAPNEGTYVVTVCVEEIRNGVVIATQRKDLQINITSCSIAAASLLPQYYLCDESTTLNLSNLSTSPLIKTYSWEIQSLTGQGLYSTTNSTLSYTFSDTGLYKIKLAVNKDQECADSISSIARVYPGFKPDFTFEGVCFTKPTYFKDASTSVLGQINSWTWSIEDASTIQSSDQNTVYTYSTMGTKYVQLVVSDSKGCMSTVKRNLLIMDKPPLSLAFRDTLICVNDKVQLQAKGNGQFSWTPGTNIINENTATPIVSPRTTTTYVIQLDDNDCLNKDSVKVRVTDHVSLQAMRDTIICQGDPIQLRVVSDAFTYSWTPALQLDNPQIANPSAITQTTTQYEVTANIGSCTAKAQVLVTAIPYPKANAGADTMICYNTTAQLTGTIDGSSLIWSPAATLNQPTINNPVARPKGTTAYVLSAFDKKGCPKPGRDTVVVTVLPPIKPFAGRDTAVVSSQPLQLEATGGVRYVWSPATGLSAQDIANPVAVLFPSGETMVYKVSVFNEAGCVDSALIRIKVFEGPPTVFVPTAFTPNKDGLNDLLRPIAAGLKHLDYFRIYNRWGQLVFSTTVPGIGWDGTINGNPQASGVYVWVLKGVDYRGQVITQKGTSTLIR
ncbi:MAG: gliding motility-associated C-terminal domain-containing protein [Flavisolibacter sp.]|nr:gliding motility-associated C-terminal domain-containing protein [Flavisolibacter sp.]